MSILTRRAADVRINEVDLSSSIIGNSNATAALAVVSTQGPTEPTFYSSFDDFTFDFGNPTASVSFDHYSAQDYFKEGNSLWAVRAISSDAKFSGLVIKNTSGGVTGIAGISGGVVDPDDPQWATIVSGGDVAIYQVTPKRGPGSYGNNLAVSIESQSLDQVGTVSTSLSATGGSLAALTYNYRVAAIGPAGEALASSVASRVVASGTTNKITLTWPAVTGAYGYYIYGRSGGTLYRMATVGAATLTFEDTGAITPDVNYQPIINPVNLPTPTGVFILKVFDASQSLTTPVESFTCSVNEQVDETGAQMETVQRVNPFSRYIRIASNVVSIIPTPEIKSVVTPVKATGGASGSAPSSADINNAVNVFSNKEMYVIDVFMSSGRASVSVMQNLEQLARTRNDAVAFLDVPSASQTHQAAIDFRNLTLNLNSSYAALFCSDLLEADPINGKALYIPPSGAMAALYARTSRIAQPWFSIAGLNRGLLDILGIRYTYDDGQATRLFQSQINYTRRFVGRGIPLWEQSTLYNKNSALQFLNVRFLCNILKRSMYDYLLYGLQEPGDDILRKQLQFGLEEYLKLVKATRGISSYRVVITDVNNPPALVNSGILAVSVVIVPILAVREIQLTLVLSKQGLQVTEAELAAF